MADDFTVAANIHRDDQGNQTITLQLGPSCPAEEEEPTPDPVIAPPPAPVSVLALSSTNPSLRVNVSWPHVSTATAYQVERQNVTDDPGVWASTTFSGVTPAFSDTTVVDTKEYIYRVRAQNFDNDGLPQYSSWTSSNTVTADDIDPLPETPDVMSKAAPRNLTGEPTGATAFTLAWDGMDDADQYKIYADFRHIATVDAPDTDISITTATTGIDGRSLWRNGTMYRVSAVVDGVETLPSAPFHTIGNNPGWDFGASPPAPSAPTTFPQWQGGEIDAPRNLVRWKAPGAEHCLWNVYRDGVLVKERLFVMYYVDDDVVAGTTYEYTVSRLRLRPGNVQTESAESTGTNCVTLSAAPTTGGTVTGITVVDNDDSVIVRFSAFSGAADYRVYFAGTMDYKYRGDHSLLEIEYNGMPRTSVSNLVIEALNMLGPFEHDEIPKVDPMHMHVNGQGDPSNVPVVLASASFTAQPTARTWTGQTPIFLDCFDTRPVFTVENGVEPAIWSRQGATFAPNNSANPWVQKLTGVNWIIRQYIADAVNTRTFYGHNHLMDALYDGGGQGNGDPSPPHNNNATWLMEAVPVALVPDAPRCLHVTFEVDPHSNSRRWMGLLLTPQNDPIIRPAIQKLEGDQAPSESGDAFAWEIEADVHKAWTFHGNGGGTAIRRSVINSGFVANEQGPGAPQRFGRADRSYTGFHAGLPGGRTSLNGPANWLDRRVRFDLIINKTFIRVYEDDRWMAELTFPVPLDFTNCKVSLTHHVYHTANDIDEITDRGQDETFWVNMRPFNEARHWDTCGFRVLATTPANTTLISSL